MTAEPGRPPAPQEPAAPPAAFTAEIAASVRFERRLALKTLVVLAALAVILVLRALYLS
jgi:hypothetical protein